MRMRFFAVWCSEQHCRLRYLSELFYKQKVFILIDFRHFRYLWELFWRVADFTIVFIIFDIILFVIMEEKPSSS